MINNIDIQKIKSIKFSLLKKETDIKEDLIKDFLYKDF